MTIMMMIMTMMIIMMMMMLTRMVMMVYLITKALLSFLFNTVASSTIQFGLWRSSWWRQWWWRWWRWWWWGRRQWRWRHLSVLFRADTWVTCSHVAVAAAQSLHLHLDYPHNHHHCHRLHLHLRRAVSPKSFNSGQSSSSLNQHFLFSSRSPSLCPQAADSRFSAQNWFSRSALRCTLLVLSSPVCILLFIDFQGQLTRASWLPLLV